MILQFSYEEHIDKTFSDINFTSVFFGQSPRAIEIKAKIDKWDLTNWQAFAQQRKPWTKWRDEPMDWGKVFAT